MGEGTEPTCSTELKFWFDRCSVGIILCRYPVAMLATLFVFAITGCSGKPPTELGVEDGRLADCPPKPNCVSSQANDTSRFVEPLIYDKDEKAAMATIRNILENIPGAEVIRQEGGYLWAEFRSNFFGFIDDVEFYFPQDKKVIHIRSASRIGYYDFGANEERISRIRALWRESVTGDE